MAKRDYYDILGVSKQSSAKEIKSAFKKLAKKYHPDISKEENAKEKFQEIQEAYSILSDDKKKSQYDQYGHEAFDQMSGGSGFSSDFDFSDIFSEMFGGSFGGGGGFGRTQRRSPNDPQSGRDMEISILLDFKDAVFGVEKTFAIKREQDCKECNGVGAKNPSDVSTCSTCGGHGIVQQQQRTMLGVMMTEVACPKCSGRGKTINKPCHGCHGKSRKTYSDDVMVKIPAGVETGSYLRVPNKGEGGKNKGQNGDLFLNISVRDHDFFKRQGLDIHVEIPISYSQAVLGSEVEVPTIHGKVDLKIPSGTASGSLLKLRHQGIKAKAAFANKIGDQYVKVKIMIPKKISDKEKKIIKELGEFDEKQTNQKSFFDKIREIF